MSGPRAAPSRLGSAVWRFVSGRAGWGGIAVQLALLGVVLWLGHEIVANARANLEIRRIATGFDFLNQTAGFGVSQALIAYSESDTYARVFLVGLLNTLLVSAVGIVFATVLGFAVGLARLSPNWLLAKLASGYVELVRNLPALFQILFWYLAVLGTLPSPNRSASLFGLVYFSNRGIVMPRPVAAAGFEVWMVVIVAVLAAVLGIRWYAGRRLTETGRALRTWPWIASLVAVALLAAASFAGTPVTFEQPALRGFNFAGGLRIVPEFAALTIALSTYTAAFIAEIVRAGVQSVPKGQVEAGMALGLTRAATLKQIVIPQALRLILPPLTNQYLNLTKNSSLAVAIGYPDLFSVFAGTTLSQTGQAIEIIAITMGVYLLLSLLMSLAMNAYNHVLISRGAAA
jgi:general L-amino acid transport system permease protein